MLRSLTGRLGIRCAVVSKKINCGMTWFMCSNRCAWLEEETPMIQEAAGYIKKKAGADYCKKITEENPEKIIRGEKDLWIS